MPETITSDDAHYAYDIVKRICTEVGPGLPGSSQERERAAILKEEMESHLGVDNVAVEEFTVAPGAFLSAYPLSSLFTLIAALLNISTGRSMGIAPWLTAAGALAFSIIAPLQYVIEFVLGRELVDPLFKKKLSVNVTGRLRNPGSKNVERLLILSGHHDSAPENTWLRLLGYGFFFLTATLFISFITMSVISLIQLAGVITGNADAVRTGTIGWALLAYPIVPTIIFGLTFTRGWKNGGNVPGATDNLAASALAVAMCRFLVKNPAYIPSDTEIRFVSFGSEEAGLRGSRCYVRRHLEELRGLEVLVLNYEMVADPEITILTSDINGTVRNSPEIVQSVAAAAKRAGVPHKVKPGIFGTATDSAPFSQAGFKALTLFPFKAPQQMVAFYHQKWDSPEILTIEPLLNVLKLTFEWVRNGGK